MPHFLIFLNSFNFRIDSEDEFKKAIEKIPDYKIKAEKVKDLSMFNGERRERVRVVLLPPQEDQIEVQLDLIKRRNRRSRRLTVSPSVSPAGPGSPAEGDSPALMTSHQRSHIGHVDTVHSTSLSTCYTSVVIR